MTCVSPPLATWRVALCDNVAVSFALRRTRGTIVSDDVRIAEFERREKRAFLWFDSDIAVRASNFF